MCFSQQWRQQPATPQSTDWRGRLQVLNRVHLLSQKAVYCTTINKMSSRNFNTKEMKIAFFDIDEDDRNVQPLSQPTMTKLLAGISYGIERSINRDTNVRMVVVLEPDSQVTAEQTTLVMDHLEAKDVTVISTFDEVVIGKIDGTNRIFALKLIGGARFVASSAGATDDGSTGSDFGFVEEGLTQECNMAV